MATAALRGLLRHLHVASKAPASVQNRYIIGGGECPRPTRPPPPLAPRAATRRAWAPS
jgi:hypothetical protein